METSDYEAASAKGAFYARLGLDAFVNHAKYNRAELLRLGWIL